MGALSGHRAGRRRRPPGCHTGGVAVHSRGSLRIYLGAAPGVGRTVAMLDEGHRRKARGTDVVVAYADTRDRPYTAQRLVGLESVAPTAAAVAARRPQVVLIDDLGTCPAPGSLRNWELAEEVLGAGIDVIATVDIASVESLVDAAAGLSGTVSPDRVPDTVLARAAQIELVDVAPAALRRRLAHGNIVAADALDTATARRFEAPVLAALRELTLTWLLERLRRSPLGADGPVPEQAAGRERILVALSGAPDGERLIRRAARLAGRADGELLGVAILNRVDPATAGRLRAHRQLLEAVGGAYQEVLGDDVVETLLNVARSEGVTQLVIGASPRTWSGRSLVADLAARARGIDVHVVGGSAPGRRRRTVRLPDWRRQTAAAALATVLLPVLTAVMVALRDRYSLPVALLAYIVVVVAVTSIGGALVGFGCAVAAFFLANFFFAEPVHTFVVRDSDAAVALLVFLLVTAIVSAQVNLERRRSIQAELAGQEAEAVATAAVVLARASDPVEGLVEHLSRALDGRATVLEEEVGGRWEPLVNRGSVAGSDPTLVTVDGRHRLRIAEPALPAPLRRLASAVASQLATAIQSRYLRAASERDRDRVAGDAYRTALLQAVSHDLRTPLTSIKTSVSSLLAPDVAWNEADTREFLEVIDGETDRLDRLIANLLDMSRLQTGAIHVRMEAVVPADVIAEALDGLSHVPPGRCRLVVEDPDVLVDADPALLERVVANLVANAHRAAPTGTDVVVRVGAVDGATAQIHVVDRGPGIPAGLRPRALEPFGRLSDRAPGSGIGLGLAIARGFVTAMGGELTLDDTPGGGLTVSIRLHRPAASQGEDPEPVNGTDARPSPDAPYSEPPPTPTAPRHATDRSHRR